MGQKYKAKDWHIYVFCKVCQHRFDKHDMNCLECCPVFKNSKNMELNSELERLQKYSPIDAELKRAKKKHPNYPTNMYEQLAIMQEEAGEVTKAVLHYQHEGGRLQDVKDELIQTAAMCMRMLQALDNGNYNKSTTCPYCGHQHPLVAEFGCCGSCANKYYDTEQA